MCTTEGSVPSLRLASLAGRCRASGAVVPVAAAAQRLPDSPWRHVDTMRMFVRHTLCAQHYRKDKTLLALHINYILHSKWEWNMSGAPSRTLVNV